jgi:hypothetical protein
MPFARQILVLFALLGCALIAQQSAPSPEAADLKKQIAELEKRLDAMDARLKRVEKETTFRMTPLTQR